jgi:hypothetical protein
MYANGRCIYTQVGAFTRARWCLRIRTLWVCIVLYTHVADSEHACTPRGRVYAGGWGTFDLAFT